MNMMLQSVWNWSFQRCSCCDERKAFPVQEHKRENMQNTCTDLWWIEIQRVKSYTDIYLLSTVIRRIQVFDISKCDKYCDIDVFQISAESRIFFGQNARRPRAEGEEEEEAGQEGEGETSACCSGAQLLLLSAVIPIFRDSFVLTTAL